MKELLYFKNVVGFEVFFGVWSEEWIDGKFLHVIRSADELEIHAGNLIIQLSRVR